MSDRPPGHVRDAIQAVFEASQSAELTVGEIVSEVESRLGGPVAPSSVRSYLQIGETKGYWEHTGWGKYTQAVLTEQPPLFTPSEEFTFGRQKLLLADCMDWLKSAALESISAVVTDPPYGLVEYSSEQQEKLRSGKGGVWRIPPSFDGTKRKPAPRFTVLDDKERDAIRQYFKAFGKALAPVLRPGAHVVIASNPLVSPLVAIGMEEAGFERRGEIVRLVGTFRGGDRPKGAEKEYPNVSSMPRSGWEPWGLYRKPISEPTVALNLKRWGTGALRRISENKPFPDVIASQRTPKAETAVATHPSMKPQAFVRAMVEGLLPTGEGIVLDPFAGCATTLAACEAKGFTGVGIEIDPYYFDMAKTAIPVLAALGQDCPDTPNSDGIAATPPAPR